MEFVSHSQFTAGDSVPVESHRFQVCADEYVAHAAPIFARSPIRAETGLEVNSIEVWENELCNIVRAESNPFVMTRNAQHVQNAGHLIEVTRFSKGTARGMIGDNILNRVPGPIYVLDLGQRFRTFVSQFEMEQLIIPKSIVGTTIEDPTVEIAIEVTHPTGYLLHACMDELFEVLGGNANRLPLALFERFVALLKVNLGVSPQREDVRRQFRQSLYEQICRYIEQNLGKSDLSVDLLLQKFGVSRASLFRMFEPYGGVRSYILQRRVARAVMDLDLRRGEHGRMRDAVEQWGFSSQPNFNRAIRRAFGTNPSSLFRMHPAPSGFYSNSGHMFHEFLSKVAA